MEGQSLIKAAAAAAAVMEAPVPPPDTAQAHRKAAVLSSSSPVSWNEGIEEDWKWNRRVSEQSRRYLHASQCFRFPHRWVKVLKTAAGTAATFLRLRINTPQLQIKVFWRSSLTPTPTLYCIPGGQTRPSSSGPYASLFVQQVELFFLYKWNVKKLSR